MLFYILTLCDRKTWLFIPVKFVYNLYFGRKPVFDQGGLRTFDNLPNGIKILKTGRFPGVSNLCNLITLGNHWTLQLGCFYVSKYLFI